MNDLPDGNPKVVRCPFFALRQTAKPRNIPKEPKNPVEAKSML